MNQAEDECPASGQDVQTIRDMTAPIAAARGWMKFQGIVFIIQGVFIALTIIGLLIAWLPIWIGVVLIQAANSLSEASYRDDKAAYLRAMDKLKLFFVIQGVLLLISLILYAISFFTYGVAVMAAFGNGGSL